MHTYTFKQMNFWQRILVNALLLVALAGLFPQGLYIQSIWTAVMAALVLGVMNALVRPVLQLLALPLTLLTFGFFAFVVNAGVLWMTAGLVGSGFRFAHFGWAILISMLMSLVNTVISDYFSRH